MARARNALAGRKGNAFAQYLSTSGARNAARFLGNPDMTPATNFAAQQLSERRQDPTTEDYYARVLTETGSPEQAAWRQFAELSGGETPTQGEERRQGYMRDALDIFLGSGAAARGIDAAQAVAGQKVRQFFDPQMPSNVVPMTAYHGSPHKFDKFDSSKIGTGEGAQVYGHGLYVAEDPAIGKFYRDATAEPAVLRELKLGSRRIGQRNGFDYNPRAGYGDEDYVMGALAEDLLINESDLMTAAETGRLQEHVMSVLDGQISNYAAGDWPEGVAPAKLLRRKLDKPGAVSADILPSEGHLYEVDLPDEKIAQMLDWDAPLSEQPEVVREALSAKLAQEAGVPLPMAREQIDATADTGAQWYRNESAAKGGAEIGSPIFDKRDDAAMSAWLREAGIPGIKYFDAAGGGRATGEGTRNFVVFDDSLLKILSRNGETL